MAERIAIQVRGLEKSWRAVAALRGVDLDLEPGAIHGIIGPDGAGKTTLLRHLIGLLRPDRGSIAYLLDHRPCDLEEIRERVAYMPQQSSLYPDLSVGEHLDFFRDLYLLTRAVYTPRRERLLAMTRMAPFIDRPAAELSGGMYKKLGLMCALLQSPRAVLLDEPTNGVDPISRREFWDLLYSLAGESILVVISTSYMDEAERCGRVHIMHSGRMLLTGEPRSLLAQAKEERFESLFKKLETDHA
jgi:ABC-2 type transport system ATP-binding protein